MLSLKINLSVQRLRLESAVSWPSNVIVDSAGKVQIRLNKKKPGLWSRFGTVEFVSETVDEYWEASIVSRTEITHDTYQIDLAYTKCVFNYIPVSHHVFIKIFNEGKFCTLSSYLFFCLDKGQQLFFSSGMLHSFYKSNKKCVRISINTLFEFKSLSPLLRYSNSVEQLLYDLEVCVVLMSHVGILVYALVSKLVNVIIRTFFRINCRV